MAVTNPQISETPLDRCSQVLPFLLPSWTGNGSWIRPWLRLWFSTVHWTVLPFRKRSGKGTFGQLLAWLPVRRNMEVSLDFILVQVGDGFAGGATLKTVLVSCVSMWQKLHLQFFWGLAFLFNSILSTFGTKSSVGRIPRDFQEVPVQRREATWHQLHSSGDCNGSLTFTPTICHSIFPRDHFPGRDLGSQTSVLLRKPSAGWR